MRTGFDTPADSARSLPYFSLRAVRPERKLAAAAVFSLCAALLSRPEPALGAVLFAALLLCCSGLPLRDTAPRLASVNAFFLPFWLLLPLSPAPAGDARTLFSLGPLAFSTAGFEAALLIWLKGNAAACALAALAGSSTLAENGRALRALRVPDKMTALLLITYANLGLMAREYVRLFQAARLRGFVPGASPAACRVYARLIGLLLIRSRQKARRVEQAMLLRGFRGCFPLLPAQRSSPPAVRLRDRRASALLFALCCLAGGALVLWDVML
ncbi:MAG: energy-coupling factor transporter transmembrane protein EcfT [Desulfovibrio sp.]|nr:energy-coupling factor transporter transmembrane protein EcfT [Desulfovibrio sp.]